MKNKLFKTLSIIVSLLFIFYFSPNILTVEGFSSKKTEENFENKNNSEQMKFLNTDIPSEGVNGNCGENAQWTLSASGELTVFGNGNTDNWTLSFSAPWSIYREKITSVIVDGQVSSIGDYAFYYCTSLSSVVISSSVTSIGKHVFSSCIKMQSVTFQNDSKLLNIGESAFSNCSALTSILIPASVTEICKNAFYNCNLLSSFYLSKNISNIGEGAFAFCMSLTSINVNEQNTNYSGIDGVLFNKNKTEIIHFPSKKDIKEYSIPSSVTKICGYAFGFCSDLTSVIIPSYVTEIGMYGFYECNVLKTVTFENGSLLSIIGDYAFYSCELLSSIEIPKSVSSIGDYAFNNCSLLSSVDIPSSVSHIGVNAFGICKSLQSISVEKNNVNYCSIDGILFNKNVTELIQFPNGNKTADYIIPSSVEKIGSYAFGFCSNLSSVDIPTSVTAIGNGAFYLCISLTSIAVPSSIINIEKDAFRLSGLTSVYFYGSEPTVESISTVFPSDVVIYCIDGEEKWSDSWNVYTMLKFTPPESSLSYIKITTPPTKKDYYLYEIFDTEGMVVTAYFEDKSSKIITDYYLSEQTAESLSDTSIKIVFNLFGKTKTALMSITVNEWPENIIAYGKYGETSYWTVDNEGTLVIGGKGGIDNEEDDDVPMYGWSGYDIYVNKIMIKNGITSIAKYAFADFIYLESFVIEKKSHLVKICDYAFRGCTMLSSAEIPSSVAEIGACAFLYCTSMTSLKIEENSVLTDIKEKAFSNCENLFDVVIPASVKSIGDKAFYSCPKLEFVYFRGNAPNVTSDSFDSSTVTLLYLDGTLGWDSSIGNVFTIKMYSLVSDFDLTGDGKTNIIDAIILKNKVYQLSEIDSPSKEDLEKYDANNDNKIDIADLESIIYSILNNKE